MLVLQTKVGKSRWTQICRAVASPSMASSATRHMSEPRVSHQVTSLCECHCDTIGHHFHCYIEELLHTSWLGFKAKPLISYVCTVPTTSDSLMQPQCTWLHGEIAEARQLLLERTPEAAPFDPIGRCQLEQQELDLPTTSTRNVLDLLSEDSQEPEFNSQKSTQAGHEEST